MNEYEYQLKLYAAQVESYKIQAALEIARVQAYAAAVAMHGVTPTIHVDFEVIELDIDPYIQMRNEMLLTGAWIGITYLGKEIESRVLVATHIGANGKIMFATAEFRATDAMSADGISVGAYEFGGERLGRALDEPVTVTMGVLLIIKGEYTI